MSYQLTLRRKIKTFKIPWTLLFVLPLLYFTLFDQPGFVPSAPTLSVGLVSLIFIPWLSVKAWRRRSLAQTPLDYPLVILLVLCLTSALFSLNFRLTFYSLWLLLVSILTFYLILDQLQAGQEDSLWKANFLVVTLVLELAALEYVAWYFGFFPWLGFEVSWPQVAGWTIPPVPYRLGIALFTVPIAPPFSGYVALFIPAALGLVFSTRRLSIRLGFIGFILLALVILILTFSRTGLVALMVGLLIFTGLSWYSHRLTPVRWNFRSWLIQKWDNSKQKYLVIALIIILALFITILFFNRTYLYSHLLGNRTGSNQDRISLLQAAWLMWLDHPWFGVGPGLFGLFYKNYIPPNALYRISISAHSVYFQLLAETGLAGVLATGVLLLVGLRMAHKQVVTATDTGRLWRLTGVISSLAVFLTTAGIEHIWFLAFIIPFCFLAAYLFYDPTRLTSTHAAARSWLPGFYLIFLALAATTLIYTNKVAERFLTIVDNPAPGQELAAAAEIRQLQTYDPGLPIYTIGQAYYQGKYIIETLQIQPCASPPLNIPATEKTLLTAAIKNYEMGLRSIKSHSIYWANLASLYWLNHQPELAQAALDQAVALSDINDLNLNFYLLNSGCYHELQNQTEAAITTYGQLLARSPDLITSPFWQASEFRITHQEDVVTAAIQQQPSRQAQLLLAINLESARDNSAALKTSLNKLVASYPDDPTTMILQARNFLKQQRYQESLALANQLEDYQLLGEIALAIGHYAQARSHLGKAIFLQNDDTTAYYILAQVALAEGNTNEAINYLRRITPPFTSPTTTDTRFVYGYPANFLIYPSLLLLSPAPLQGHPYQLLSSLYQKTGQTDLANTVEQARTSYDPYLKN